MDSEPQMQKGFLTVELQASQVRELRAEALSSKISVFFTNRRADCAVK